MKLRFLVLTALLTLPLASSFAQVGISINVAPPVLPVVEQPPCPVEGYIWTPGYWAWGGGDYYLVPGAWVAPPVVGVLWTPPWWGWANGAYLFHEGYWGPTVGFYGGINYGHGYWGDGYWGGHWEGNAFHYNTAVTHVNNTVIHNTYVDRSVTNKEVNRTHTSFNGPNGVKADATAEQKAAAENAHKMPPTSQQLARQDAASKDHNLQASVNHGNPKPDAIKSFNQTHEHGTGAEGVGAGKNENKTGTVAKHEQLGAGKAKEHGTKHEAENLHGNKHNVEGNHAKQHTYKTAGYGGAGHGPHAMNQQMAHRQQMGPQHHPPPGGGNRSHPGGQQQGKKKEGNH